MLLEHDDAGICAMAHEDGVWLTCLGVSAGATPVKASISRETTTRDAITRLRSASGRGWSCGLKHYHCSAISVDRPRWVGDLGMPTTVYQRILGAARHGRGVRLSADEVRCLRLGDAT